MRILASLAIAGVVLVPAVRAASPAGVAAVPRPRRRRHRRRRDAARLVVDDRARRLDGRDARPRLVVADRLWRDRVFVTSAVSPGAFKAPSTGHLRQRLRRRAREAGAAGRRDHQAACVARDIELTERVRRDQLHGLRARRADRQGRCGSAKRTTARRSAAAIARTPTRRRRRPPTASASTRRSAERRRVLLHARRHAAVDAHLAAAADLSRLRHGLVAGRPRRPRLSAARQRRRSRSSPRSTRRPAREIWNVARTDLAGRLASGWATPLDLGERARTEIVTIGRGFVISYDLDGKELWRLKGMTPGDAEPDRGRRPALRRLGLAGRSEPAALRGAARRDAATSR